ncbi:MAG: acyl-CoA desaturase [Bacteroidales bacterium]|nr:acyl-CoA desaturase [Bacteroidales bacterium]
MTQNKIKFPGQKQPDFIKELRTKVDRYFAENQLSKFGNSNLAIKAVFMLSLYLLPYFLMIFGVIESFGGVLFCWVLMGMGKAGVGMGVMHDANHHVFSKNPKINKWLEGTMYLVGGFPQNWQYQHNVMHHGFTNIDGHDEDIDPGSVLRLSPHKPLLKVQRFQHIYAWFLYGLMTFSWVTTKDFSQLKRYKDTGVKLNSPYSYKQLFRILLLAKALYYSIFLIIPMIVLPFAWYWIILFFLAMHFTSGFILTTIFQTAHVVPSSEYPLPDESGNMENNWAIHQLYTTSDFAPKSKVLSWFIGGLNFQVEHHLFPNISHVHYPKIAPLVKETAAKYNLPYHVQPGFLKALVEHGRMLRNLGREMA